MPVDIVEFRDENKGDSLRGATKSSICILPISVGQKYHEQDAWDQTVQLINENFAACIIVVVDSLHRFTEEMKMPIQQEETNNSETKSLKQTRALERALEDGVNWINAVQARWRGEGVSEKAARHIPKFTIPVSFTRWDDWTSHETYSLKKEYIDRMYRAEGTTPISEDEYKEKYRAPKIRKFHDLVDHTVGTFVQGFIQRAAKIESEDNDDDRIEFDIVMATQLSKAYVLEELAMVEMCRSHAIPRNALLPEINQLITPERHVYLAYFFGQNSTNKKVLECFNSFQSDDFHFLTLADSQKKRAQQQRKSEPQDTPEQNHVLKQKSSKKKIFLSEKDINSHVAQLSGATEERITTLTDKKQTQDDEQRLTSVLGLQSPDTSSGLSSQEEPESPKRASPLFFDRNNTLLLQEQQTPTPVANARPS